MYLNLDYYPFAVAGLSPLGTISAVAERPGGSR